MKLCENVAVNNQIEDEGKRSYTINEIQDILGISRNTAYSLVHQNVFRSIRIGTHIRISKKSFDTWLDNNL